MTQAEGLRHRERAVGEVGVRGDQAQRYALPRHGVQRQQGLQAGNTAAGDDDVHGPHHRAPLSNGARWAAKARGPYAAAISVLIADAGAASADYVRVMTTTAALPLAAIEAHSVMSPGLVTCLPGAALTEVATLMAVHQVHAVVVDPDAARLITARDVLRAALGGATTAEEVLAPETP